MKLIGSYFHFRYTHNEKRYHSEVRQEAVQQALAAMAGKTKNVPLPSKRSSVLRTKENEENGGDTSTDDDFDDEDDDSSIPGIDNDSLEHGSITRGLSDTSSNHSAQPPEATPPLLPRVSSMAASPSVPSRESEDSVPPELPSRSVSQDASGPNRPLPLSPSRQMQRQVRFVMTNHVYIVTLFYSIWLLQCSKYTQRSKC